MARRDLLDDRFDVEPVPPTVRFVPIDPPPIRRIFALWREGATARPAIGTILDALERHPVVAGGPATTGT